MRPPLVDATDGADRARCAADLRRGPGVRRSGATPSEPRSRSWAPPPPLPDGGLRVIPLGGLGAIGRNMTVFEYDGKLLIVDCGVLFPDVDQPGVDLILPDFSLDPGPARRRPGDRAHPRPRGPHRRGAVPAARTSRTSRWSAPSSRWRWSRRSCAERRIEPYTLTVAARADRAARPVRAASSSRSTTRSRTRSRWPSGPPAGAGAAHRRLQDGPAAAGRPAHRPGRLRPARRGGRRPAAVRLDQRRGPGLRHPGARDRPGARLDLRARRPGGSSWPRFASHVHRVQQVLDSAAAHGRKVAFIGRSMVRNMGIARDLGLLHIPPGLVVGAGRGGRRCRRSRSC